MREVPGIISELIKGVNSVTEGIKEKNEITPSKSELKETGNQQEGVEEFNPFKRFQIDALSPQDTEKMSIISDRLCECEELRRGRWENLSVEERLQTLNHLEGEIAQITKRNPCQVAAKELPSTTRGYHLHNKIVLNTSLITDGSPEGMKQTLRTFLHEGRHAYQEYNVNVREIEPNTELIRAWKLNYEMGYEEGKNGIFDYKQMGFKRYLTQPLEVDARVFAESVLNRMNL